MISDSFIYFMFVTKSVVEMIGGCISEHEFGYTAEMNVCTNPSLDIPKLYATNHGGRAFGGYQQWMNKMRWKNE